MNKTKMIHGPVSSWAVTRDGGMLVIQMFGLCSVTSAGETRRLIRMELIEREAVKVLVDIRGAAIALTEHELERLAEEELQDRPLSAPVGILSLPHDWEGLFAYCMGMAQRGRTRFVFSLPEKASQWLGVPLPHTQAAPALRQAA